MIAKKKKISNQAEVPNNDDRQQTTARIPRALYIEVNSRRKKTKPAMDQIEAINDGLKLWLVYQYADDELAKQLREGVKQIESKLRKIEEELNEKEAGEVGTRGRL